MLICERVMSVLANCKVASRVFLATFSVFFAGCGGDASNFEKLPLYPASGTVTMDGKPYGPVSLRFEPEGGLGEGTRGFVAMVDGGGSFDKVTTYESGDGAPVGTYLVTVFSSGGVSDPFPAIYEDAKKTPLKVIVSDITGDGANGMTIQLDSKAGGGDGGNSTTGHFDFQTMQAMEAGAQ